MTVKIIPDSPNVDILGAFARIAINNVFDDDIQFILNGIHYQFTMDDNCNWTIRRTAQNRNQYDVKYGEFKTLKTYTNMSPRFINRSFNGWNGSTEYTLTMEPTPFSINGCLDISVVFPRQT